jgi:hypothetical protein
VATHNLLSESRSGFLLSDDERLLDMPKIFQRLSVESYWARGRGYGQRGTGSSASSLQRAMRTKSIHGPGLSPSRIQSDGWRLIRDRNVKAINR